MKQTTWFTKGLRQDADFCFRPSSPETNDLIYEGIATDNRCALIAAPVFIFETNDLIYEGIATAKSEQSKSQNEFCKKQTTWFTKGLRRALIVTVGCLLCCVTETNDLIYEGIAT